jgi:hypothetical protein
MMIMMRDKFHFHQSPVRHHILIKITILLPSSFYFFLGAAGFFTALPAAAAPPLAAAFFGSLNLAPSAFSNLLIICWFGMALPFSYSTMIFASKAHALHYINE